MEKPCLFDESDNLNPYIVLTNTNKPNCSDINYNVEIYNFFLDESHKKEQISKSICK